MDIFFVISGFLITGLLLRELERHGRISFLNFYRRRVRRILPAAALVLVATLIFAALFYSSDRINSVSWDALAAAAFVANWHFIAVGTDYFNTQAALSPVQHFWSLSVEEQFYLVWPIVMLGTFAAVSAISRKRHRLALTAAITLLGSASFAWALSESATNPTWAYFSTLSRAWELAMGALLAIALPLTTKAPRVLKLILASTGTLAIACSLFVTSGTSGFPAPGAALPVLATSLVIAADAGRFRMVSWPLANPVAEAVGNLSYSIYLWHFPIIVLIGGLFEGRTIAYYVMVLTLVAALSMSSYYFLEEPIRTGRWLSGTPGHRAGRERRIPPGQIATSYGTVLLAVISLLSASSLAWSSLPKEAAPFIAVSVAGGASSGPSATTSPQQAELTAALAEAYNRQAWPDLTPRVGDRSWVPEWTKDKCLDVTEVNFVRCRYGEARAKKLAVVVGDSIAVSYMPGLERALERDGYALQLLTYEQCPAAAVRVVDESRSSSFTATCGEHQNWAIRQIESLKPDLVIASSAYNSIRLLQDRKSGPAALSEWAAGVQQFMTESIKYSKAAVVLDPPPEGINLGSCYSASGLPSRCANKVSSEYNQFVAATQRGTTLANVEHISTVPWFCLSSICPAFADSTIKFADSQHLTPQYSRLLTGVMLESLKKVIE